MISILDLFKKKNVSSSNKFEEKQNDYSQNKTEVKNENSTEKTEIYNLIILDKSGSMHSIANAAISGFNETVESIRMAQEKHKDTQKHFVSLMVFCNCDKRLVYDKVPVDKVTKLTSKDYRPCGCTPLYDAMGISLTALRNDIKDKNDATAVVTIITDGLENASKEYHQMSIKALVEDLTDNEGWTFSYIGTNHDVDRVSKDLHIDNHMFFVDDEEGMRNAWELEREARERRYTLFENDHFDYYRMPSEERKRFRSKRNRENKYYE